MTLQLLHDLPPPALNLVHVGLRLQFESLMFTEVCVCAVYSSSSRETQAGKKKGQNECLCGSNPAPSLTGLGKLLILCSLLFVCLLFSFFGHPQGTCKFPGQGSKPRWHCNLHHSCSSTGSLTHCTGLGMQRTPPQRQVRSLTH